jgi:hypothetical protein
LRKAVQRSIARYVEDTQHKRKQRPPSSF